MHKENSVSDEYILTLIRENDPLAWNALYDKYAAAMYGLIHSLTSSPEMAERIFMAAFRRLKSENKLKKITHALCPVILRYTYSCTMEMLPKQGINNVPEDARQDTKLISLFLTKCNSIKEAASLLNITEEETKNKLHVEVSELINPALRQHG